MMFSSSLGSPPKAASVDKQTMYYQEQPGNRTVELYGPDFMAVYNVPVDAIAQMPSKKLNVTRLVACSNYTAAVARGSPQPSDEKWCADACSAGPRCRFVHVTRPLSQFPNRTIHVHYIWQSLEAVTYARQWDGQCSHAPTVWLMNPPDCRAEVKRYDEQRERSTARLIKAGGDDHQHNKDEDERVAFAMMVDLIASVAPAMRIPATRLLKTVGATTYLQRRGKGIKPDYPLSPCPDYMCHNECRMGEECPNAHVINLDVSQGTPFVRRTLRHVKAASEATMVQNEGRVQNGLLGMVSERSKPKVVEVESTVVEVHGGPMTAILGMGASESPGGNTNSYSNGVSKNNSTDPPSTGNQGSSDIVPVGVADTETSSSPMQFNASTLATLSTGNSSQRESGGYKGNGYGSSHSQPSITSDTESTDNAH